MPSSNGGRGGYKNKKDNNNSKDAAMFENLRGACPPHKKKDLDKLFKQMHGDETKIMEKIQEWWEEPAPNVEESWAAVNKKVVKKKPMGDRRDRGRGGGRDSGGRGGARGGGRGGRGGGRERNGKREERPRNADKKIPKTTDAVGDPSTTAPEKDEQQEEAVPVAPASTPVGVPTPVNAPVLKGAWGARVAALTPNESAASSAKASEESATAASDAVEQAVPVAAPAAPKSSSPEVNPLAADASSSVQTTPEIPAVTTESTAAVPLPAPRTSGNVWATKGSAHLIQAEKEPVPAPPAPVVEEPEIIAPPSPSPVEQPSTESSSGPTLKTGLALWGSQPAASPEPAPEPAPAVLELPITAPLLELPIPAPPTPVPEPIVEQVVPEAVVAPVSVQQPPASPAAQKVLNMGRWDTGGGDDTDNIGFGFGSFGAVTSSDSNTNDIVQQVVNKEPILSATNPGTSVSPARPPPGLSMGGMPPMPASAVMVHELENKLESASLNTKKTTAAEQGPAPGTQVPQQMMAMGQHALPSGLTQQNYNQQQLHQHQQVMPSMYNYNAAGGGFVGGMQPVLAGMPQQQPGKPHGAGIGGHSQNPHGSLPQQGLYGNQAQQSMPGAGNSSRADASATDNTSVPGAAPTAGVPPGMPSNIPYANPALHYGAQQAAAAQHQFYAMGGHQQQGIGYNYGYAGQVQQFGGAVQGGFGYPQVMGQSQGYGASHYDDQGHQGNSHHTAAGGYQNKSGGGGNNYRGRNNHSNNQYQNQYNPQQHGGYGGQPYGMSHYGHAQGGMTDPYAAMQQQQQHQQHGGIHSGGVGGFQDDDHQKGRKGRGGNNNSSLQQQFQQGGPPQLGGQGQSFGLQGQQQQQQQQQVGGIESAPSSGGGWSNQAAGGGWSGSAAQSGGWQGS